MFIGPCIIVITDESKNQLDATWYFIVLLIGSTCFRHYYAHHQELATIMLITTLVLSTHKSVHYFIGTQMNSGYQMWSARFFQSTPRFSKQISFKSDAMRDIPLGVYVFRCARNRSTRQSEEIHDLHSSWNIIPFIKSRMRWTGM